MIAAWHRLRNFRSVSFSLGLGGSPLGRGFFGMPLSARLTFCCRYDEGKASSHTDLAASHNMSSSVADGLTRSSPTDRDSAAGVAFRRCSYSRCATCENGCSMHEVLEE